MEKACASHNLALQVASSAHRDQLVDAVHPRRVDVAVTCGSLGSPLLDKRAICLQVTRQVCENLSSITQPNRRPDRKPPVAAVSLFYISNLTYQGEHLSVFRTLLKSEFDII